MKFDDLIRAYRKIRDARVVKAREMKDELGRLDEQLAKLEVVIHQKLDEQGVENIKTTEGTAFKTTKDFVTVTEIEDFREFLSDEVAGGDDELADKIYKAFPWHFFTKAVSKAAVLEYMKEHGTPPQGIGYDTQIEVQVRK